MELIDRYLEIVKDFLPREQRQDILAELSENIRSQAEEEEAKLGRALTEAEQQAILMQFGHPMLVGGRFLQQNRTLSFGRVLIGPELFPFYARILKWTMGIAMSLVVGIIAVLSLSEPQRWNELIPALQLQLSIQFVVQTVIWTLIQAHLTKYPESWNIWSSGGVSATQKAARRPHVSRFESVAQIVLLAVIFPWMHSILWPQHVAFGPGELAPIWHQVYVPVLLIALAAMAQSLVNLLHPEWVRLRDISRVVTTAAWLAVVCFVLYFGPWVIVADSTGDVALKARGVAAINHYVFYYGLLGTAVGALVALAFDVLRFIRGGKNSFPTAPARSAEQR